ncbi:uncharacterized protein LOC142234981 [Haematobia irritans]|uniref:uncharacterized protein LOC142234981 n=1 Tax=Haematobia irritans TaxID=7368 RepID=UPI003F4F48D2
MVHSRRESSRQRRSASIGEISRASARPGIYKCKMCNRFHALKVCPKFLWMTPRERKDLVLREVYCINCLARSHRFRDCRSPNMCRKCERPHHTLLHASYIQAETKRGNVRKSNSNLQRNHKLRRRSETNNNRQRGIHQTNTTDRASPNQTTPNQQLLSEAIRALASVLCSNTD